MFCRKYLTQFVSSMTFCCVPACMCVHMYVLCSCTNNVPFVVELNVEFPHYQKRAQMGRKQIMARFNTGTWVGGPRSPPPHFFPGGQRMTFNDLSDLMC